MQAILSTCDAINLGLGSFVAYPAVKLLGFLVDGFGMSTTDDRAAAITKIEQPQNLATLEMYIGMVGFLRKLSHGTGRNCCHYRSGRQRCSLHIVPS